MMLHLHRNPFPDSYQDTSLGKNIQLHIFRNPLGLHRSVEKKYKYRLAFRRNAPLKQQVSFPPAME
jgi:hypothetical protein